MTSSKSTNTVEDAIAKLTKWRFNPYLFVIEALGAIPLEKREGDSSTKVVTTQQRKMLNDLGKLAFSKKCLEANNFTKEYISEKAAKAGISITVEEAVELSKKVGISIKSGKGSGKTTGAAWAVIWFLVCFPNMTEKASNSGDSGTVVVCTATKLDQVKDVLWREISKWISTSAIRGQYGTFIKDMLEVQGEKIYVKDHSAEEGKEWYAIARSASTKQAADTPADTLQGFHARHMMIVVDEASGVPENVFIPLDDTLTSPCNFMLMIYNPTRTTGFAYNSHHKFSDYWVTHRWNCEESENVSRQSIEYKEKRYGRESNQFRVGVLALEPLSESDMLIPLEWIQSAVHRDIYVEDDEPMFMGVDVARFGNDKSIILNRRGGVVEDNIREFSKIDTQELADWVSAYMASDEPTAVGIDVIGVGAGVYDRLYHLGHKVYGVNVSEAASKNEKFHRLRDELWWKLRKLFEERRISIPDDEELIFELSNIKYKEIDGKIKVESKKEMKARGIESPNKADALVLTCYFNDASFRIKTVTDRYELALMKKANGSGQSWKTV